MVNEEALENDRDGRISPIRKWRNEKEEKRWNESEEMVRREVEWFLANEECEMREKWSECAGLKVGN